MASSLPPEIIRLILQQLGHVCTTLEDYYGHGRSQYEKPAADAATYAKTRTLLSACLVNRAWSKEAQVLLYSNISCTGQTTLFGIEAMHSNEFASVRQHFDDSDNEDEIYDDNFDGDSDASGDYGQGGPVAHGQLHEAEPDTSDESDSGQDEEEVQESPEGVAQNEATLQIVEDHTSVAYRRSLGIAPMFSNSSCSADISVRIAALRRTLSSSAELAKYVKTFSVDPANDHEIAIMSHIAEVEEVCFVYGNSEMPSHKLGRTISELHKLRRCQLHGFPSDHTYRILAILAGSTSLKALRLSSFRWGADTSGAVGIPHSYFQNVNSVLIDSAALPTAHFQALLGHLDRVSDPQKLDIRLHGISWVETGDRYNPFGELSTTTAASITAFKLRESALESSDFRDLQRLTSLRTMGIYESECDPDFTGNIGEAVQLPESITTLELGGNELDSFDGGENEDPPAVTSVVDAWLRGGKLSNLKTFVARPGDFAIMDFERICYRETHEEIAEEIRSVRRIAESLQESLDAHKVACNVKPVAAFDRFLMHIHPLWHETEPWMGILQERLAALKDKGVRYTLWKG